tara:strand:- start:11857 stop:13797 length:1941 start_codon:yes stop_codon:yes gene_type:complete
VFTNSIIARLLVACGVLLWTLSAHPAVSLPGSELVFLEREAPSDALTLTEFLAIPDTELVPRQAVISHGYTRSAYWARVYIPRHLFENSGELWLQLGPVFLDQLTVYRRSSNTPWHWIPEELGDRSPLPRGDISYRHPLLILQPPPANSETYELIFHYKSSSAVLLHGKLWKPEDFLEHASRETVFWGFYFGLASLSTGLGLLLALLTRRKLLWLLCLFSSTYLLVACIQGYIDWLLGSIPWQMQHYLTSILTLTSYGCLFWMCAEALNTRRESPRLHRLVMALVSVIFASPVSIPLDLYNYAIQMQFVLCAIAIVILGSISVRGLRRQQPRSAMERGFSVASIWYLLTALLALLSLFGVLPYQEHLYALWQYGLVVNTLIVLALITINAVNEERLERTRLQLSHDLEVSREARFHQRQFMGMVAHEFRTPLSVISAALHNLQYLDLDKTQRHSRIANIVRANERLVQLTDNCLADSRLNASHLQLEYGPTAIHQVIDSAGAIARLSPKHSLVVESSFPETSGDNAMAPDILADEGLLRIAISNLLDNAVKYSTGPEIRVIVCLSPHRLELSVCDQGPGIESRLAERLFERFQQGHLRSSGVGLGLYVSREIALAHGGDLVLTRNSPNGCCFTLFIPHHGTPADDA